MTVLIGVLVAIFVVGLVVVGVADYERRHHKHIPKASTYIPPSNVRTVSKDKS